MGLYDNNRATDRQADKGGNPCGVCERDKLDYDSYVSAAHSLITHPRTMGLLGEWGLASLGMNIGRNGIPYITSGGLCGGGLDQLGVNWDCGALDAFDVVNFDPPGQGVLRGEARCRHGAAVLVARTIVGALGDPFSSGTYFSRAGAYNVTVRSSGDHGSFQTSPVDMTEADAQGLLDKAALTTAKDLTKKRIQQLRAEIERITTQNSEEADRLSEMLKSDQ